jgi:hypothetical protein
MAQSFDKDVQKLLQNIPQSLHPTDFVVVLNGSRALLNYFFCVCKGSVAIFGAVFCEKANAIWTDENFKFERGFVDVERDLMMLLLKGEHHTIEFRSMMDSALTSMY